MTRREAMLAMVAAPGSRSANLSYILMDIREQTLLRSQWTNPREPVAPGSLTKPFAAIAYGAAHRFEYPDFTCRHCWKASGHGRLSLVDAIAYSCNSYFLDLAQACTPDDISRVASIYGLPAPSENNAETWIGLGEGWLVEPATLLRAYCELAARAVEAGPKAVLRGMHLSAQRGTASGMRMDAFAKTGTGPCAHKRKGCGDGYAVALFPAESPRYALLAGTHDSPGSEAARLAGQAIREIMPVSEPRRAPAVWGGHASHWLPRRS